MVCAILEGRKTQTRRVIKPQPVLMDSGVWYPSNIPGDIKNKTGLHYANENHMRKGMPIDFCPYGQPGDRLWVRESLCVEKNSAKSEFECGHFCYRADETDNLWGDGYKTIPSIHMPRWASRITLEIVNIRVEQVQSITTKDIVAEGIFPDRHAFENLWNSINATRGYGWDTNPWVFVIKFKKEIKR